MAKRASKKQGRPRGSRTKRRAEIVSVLGQCPRCHSTDLVGCTQKTVTEHAGQHAGKPYTHIVRRWKRCAVCWQAVVERTYEYRFKYGTGQKLEPPEEPPEGED